MILEKFIFKNSLLKIMEISALKEAGLTEGEIKVYTALLELGSSTTGPIIDKSGITRSIIYQILEKLMQKGLVSYITKNKTKYFEAARPNKILDYIDEREKKLKENKKKVESLLPELLLKQNFSEKSGASIYTGFKGLITSHEKAFSKLKKGDEYCCLGVPSFQPKEQHLYWQRDHLRRIKSGIKTRLLFNKDTPKEIMKNRNSYKGADARYMETDIKTPAYFMIYKDTVMIGIPSKDSIAIEIINQEIRDAFQAYFEEFWKKSKPFNKNKT